MDVSVLSEKTKKAGRSVAVLVGKHCGHPLWLWFEPDNYANSGCCVLYVEVSQTFVNV
jgi:hypothetical protein